MKTRPLILAISLLLGTASSTQAQISFEFGLPNINIGFNTESYPKLILIPGSPVYYAPRLDSNFFFYDGLYWIYQEDAWYSSSWYNGPWNSVGPEYVPLFVLRVPVRYYRQPPQYFRHWPANAPPRWEQHWGREWEARRSGWNKWERRSVPAAAPLPSYQRHYRGNDYPRAPEQQHSIRSENYRYQPRDRASREVMPPRREQGERRRDPQTDAPEVRQPARQQHAPDNPQTTAPDRAQPPPPAPRVVPPNHARDEPQGPRGSAYRSDQADRDEARRDQPRDAPESRQPSRQQTAPSQPQRMAPDRPQPPPPAQKLGPPTQAGDHHQGRRGSDEKSENSERKGKENHGNEQGRDRH